MPATNRNKSIFRYLWYIILIGNFIAIALLFGSVSAWYISPAKTNLFAYLGMGFPFILVLNILFLGFWILFLKWKYAAISLISLLVCIKPILTYFPVHSRTKEVPEENTIKFLSYNVRVFNWDTNKDKAANPIYQYIKNSGADIVCLQEYMSANKGNIATDAQIKKILEYYPYSSVTRIRENEKTINYGLACFSKFPILETKKIPINSTDNGAVMYKIKVNDKTISVFNNHLESNRITAEDKKLYRDFLRENTRNMIDTVAFNIKNRLGIAYNARCVQADTIAAWIERQDTDGVIVCGDFNDTPISYAYKKVKGDLSDAYAKTGFGPGITYHENHFWFRIDYIMHSDNIQPYNFTIDRVKYSDHYPIWTYLEIN